MSRCVLEGSPYQIFDKKSWFKSNFSTAELETFQFLQIFVPVVASVFSVGGELKLQFELKKLLKLKVKKSICWSDQISKLLCSSWVQTLLCSRESMLAQKKKNVVQHLIICPFVLPGLFLQYNCSFKIFQS